VSVSECVGVGVHRGVLCTYLNFIIKPLNFNVFCVRQFFQTSCAVLRQLHNKKPLKPGWCQSVSCRICYLCDVDVDVVVAVAVIVVVVVVVVIAVVCCVLIPVCEPPHISF
jgi:hypothetical protein